jgi:hypothetical protein
MRFRQEIRLLDKAKLVLGLLCLLRFAFIPHFSATSQWWIIVLPLSALQTILDKSFIYWECNPDGLRERRFWRIKDVPWEEVRQVGRWRPKAETLAVIYAHPAPFSSSGCIVADPADPAGFLAALRQFAPQAVFDI